MVILNVHNKVGRALEQRFVDNWVETSVQYFNTHLDTDNLDDYIALALLPVDSSHETLGLTINAGERRDYVMIVQIFSRRGKGSGRLEEIADNLETLFNRSTLILLNAGSAERGRIQFDVPEPPTPVNTDRSGWMQWNMSFPLRVQI